MKYTWHYFMSQKRSFRHKAQEDESSLSVGMLISDRRKSALNKVTVLSACKGRHVYTDGLI